MSLIYGRYIVVTLPLYYRYIADILRILPLHRLYTDIAPPPHRHYTVIRIHQDEKIKVAG